MTEDVAYYHQVDDPYSHLLVQVLPALEAAFDVRLAPCLVPGPPADMAPRPEMLARWSRRDAAELSRYLRLDFPGDPATPDEPAVRRAAAILAAGLDAGRFLELAPLVGDALWRGDAAALDTLAARHGEADAGRRDALIAEGAAEREARGHYLGATLFHRDTWYWGIDRLDWLESALRDAGAGRPGAAGTVLAMRPPEERPVPDLKPPATLEVFFSFRSPYSYLAIKRLPRLVERYPVRLDLRPVLPMVMRGLPVPQTKAAYIVRDTVREAARHGIDFGNFCDPVGPGVERAMAIFPYAREQDRALAYLDSVATGIWAEGVDTATDDGLSGLVRRAGLDWETARRRLGDDGWRQWAEDNQQALFDLDLWGVPSFRLGDYAAWGQDRLWIIEDRLRQLSERTGA